MQIYAFMSIDFIKARLENINIPQLLENNKLDFKSEYSRSTSEINTTKYKANLHFCSITVYESGRVMFKGSIHKMHNSIKEIKAPNYKRNNDNYKGFNGNIFYLDEIIYIRKYLCKLLNITAKNIIFENIEFGINCDVDFYPTIFISSLLYQYNKKFEFRYNGNYAEVHHSRYKIKIYNKSEQYGMTKNTLRVELQINKSIEFKKLGISTFEDIKSDTLKRAQELLLKKFDEVVYFDPTIRKKDLEPKDKQKLVLYRDIRYWLEDLEPRRRHRPLKKLRHFIAKYSDNLHSQIRFEIIKKCVMINRPQQSIKCVTINSSNIELNITHDTHRICPITREDISMQKASSFRLSNTGLKHLEKTNSEKFENLKKIFLTGNDNTFEKTVYCKISKQIRNKFYNNRSDFNGNQLRLF